jgi:hypothetical protein
LLVCFANAYATKWEKIYVDEFGSSQYINFDEIKENNRVFNYLVLIDNVEVFTDGTYSSIGKWKVDCLIEKVTWLSLTSYSQPMGKGKIITSIYHSSNLVELTPNKVIYPKINSRYYNLMKFVCDLSKIKK